MVSPMPAEISRFLGGKTYNSECAPGDVPTNGPSDGSRWTCRARTFFPESRDSFWPEREWAGITGNCNILTPFLAVQVGSITRLGMVLYL